MKHLLAWLLTAIALTAAPTCTQITGPFYVDTLSGQGFMPTGSQIQLTLQYTSQANGTFVGPSAMRATITNGQINAPANYVCLTPGNWTASYTISQPLPTPGTFNRTWVVPASGGPYTREQVEAVVPTLPSVQPVSPGLILPGGNGDCVRMETSAIPIPNWYPCGPLTVYGPTAFTNANTVTVTPQTHKFSDSNLVVLCGGNVAECGDRVRVASDGTVTMTSAAPISGNLWIIGGPAYSQSFTSATSITIPITSVPDGIALTACYDSNGYQFGAGSLTPIEHDSGIGGTQGQDYTLALMATPATGRCVFLRGGGSGGGSGAVSSVFGRTGPVTAQSGDYTSDQVTQGATNKYYSDALARAAFSATSPLSYSAGVFSIQQASGTQAGYLSAADWSTFNGKQSALGFTPLNPANNLSDLASAPTARTNLGLATVAATGSYSDLSGKPTIPTIASTSSVLKGNGSGNAVAATAGTDYAAATNGSSGQALTGDGAGGFGTPVTLVSLATRLPCSTSGAIYLNTTASTPGCDASNLSWDNTNKRLGIGTASPSYPLQVIGDIGLGAAASDATINIPATSGLVISGAQTAKFRLLPYGSDIYFQNTYNGGNINFTGVNGSTSTGTAIFNTAGIVIGNASTTWALDVTKSKVSGTMRIKDQTATTGATRVLFDLGAADSASTTIFTLNGVQKFAGTNTTGAGSAALGSNSPASTLTAPYTWIQVATADGSTAYIPAWK